MLRQSIRFLTCHSCLIVLLSNATPGSTPLLVQFTDTSDPGALPIEQWHWDFGDGWTSDEQNPEHLHETQGVYTVSLIVTTDVASDICTRWGYITADAKVPAASYVALVLVAGILTLCTLLLIRRRTPTRTEKQNSNWQADS